MLVIEHCNTLDGLDESDNLRVSDTIRSTEVNVVLNCDKERYLIHKHYIYSNCYYLGLIYNGDLGQLELFLHVWS